MSEKVLKNEISAEDRQFNRNKWLFSVSGIGRDMSYQLIASFLLTYIQFGMTLSIMQFTTISLLIGVAGRIWDAVNDPMMGAIIEGTHMKFGKFRPWILIGAVLTGSIIITMFNVQSLSGWGFVVFMAVMYLLWESAFTMNDIGYWSMLASLSSKKEQRNSATMLTVVFAGIGAFVAQGGISFLYPGNVRQAFSWISIAIAAIFIVMQLVMVLFIKERPRAQMEVNEKISIKQMWNTIKHNDQVLWMTLSMLFYNIGSSLLVGLAYNLYYIEIGYDGMAIVFIAIFGVFNIGAQIFYPMLAKKLGRKKLQLISIILACVGYLGIALLGWVDWLPFELWSLSIFGVMVFVGQAWFYMSSIINMTNCVEYNEYKRGERNEAVVSTLRPFMAKFADALKYGIVTLVLTVSAVYGLSQNISTLEVQKGHFDRMETVAEQSEYLSLVNEYLTMIEDRNLDWDNLSKDDEKYLSDLTEQMQKGALEGKQLDAKYVSALGDAAVMKDGKFLGFVRDIGGTALEDGHTYALALSGKNSEGKNFNAADDNFKSDSSLGMRLWLRAAVTVVPVLFLLAALLVQRKKFVIDEQYYDMMLDEIEKRKLSDTDECKATESAAETADADKTQIGTTEQTADDAPEQQPPQEK
ncbi:MAG: MFS transporter [Corallococcus sp.]|nr:MFS transporter [Corallococcus sp.]MCM1359630.1 MFS transporter [Corallococcus sp.]MCM1395222.1 MFS transporter [Corallococcus sp.]